MGMYKRVVHLTSVHPGDDNRIYYKECLSLADAGYEVVVICPSCASDGLDGRVKMRKIGRPKSRLWRIFATVPKVLWQAMKERGHVYHFHDPELIPVGWILKLLGKKVIYDVHEDVPEAVLSKKWIWKPLRSPTAKLLSIIEFISYYLFDRLVAATPRIGARFPNDKTVVINNYCRIEEFCNIKEGGGGRFRAHKGERVIAYVGVIAEVRGSREMVEAMRFVQTRGARLYLGGRFEPPAHGEELAASGGWEKVEYLGWLSRADVTDLLGQAEVGLVVLRPLKNYLDAQPVKLFEYMAAGIPVVASDFPLWRQIIEGAGCGILVDPMQPRQIAKAIDWLLTHPDAARRMGERGRKTIEEKYNWESEAKKLIDFYSFLEKS